MSESYGEGTKPEVKLKFVFLEKAPQTSVVGNMPQLSMFRVFVMCLFCVNCSAGDARRCWDGIWSEEWSDTEWWTFHNANCTTHTEERMHNTHWRKEWWTFQNANCTTHTESKKQTHTRHTRVMQISQCRQFSIQTAHWTEHTILQSAHNLTLHDIYCTQYTAHWAK